MKRWKQKSFYNSYHIFRVFKFTCSFFSERQTVCLSHSFAHTITMLLTGYIKCLMPERYLQL